MGFKVYDSNEVSVSIAGLNIDSGFADGEFLRIEKESDDFTDVAGTDGEVTRSRTNDKRATITLILMQTSDGNSLLSGLYKNDRENSNGAGVGALLIRDRTGTAVYEAAECWIARSPNATFGREATSREWTIRCANLIDSPGGS